VPPAGRHSHARHSARRGAVASRPGRLPRGRPLRRRDPLGVRPQPAGRRRPGERRRPGKQHRASASLRSRARRSEGVSASGSRHLVARALEPAPGSPVPRSTRPGAAATHRGAAPAPAGRRSPVGSGALPRRFRTRDSVRSTPPCSFSRKRHVRPLRGVASGGPPPGGAARTKPVHLRGPGAPSSSAARHRGKSGNRLTAAVGRR
jgi:hypothetical protein